MGGSEVVVLLHAAAGGPVGAGGGQGKEEEGGGQDRELHLAVGFFTKSATLTGTGDLSECALRKLLRRGKSFYGNSWAIERFVEKKGGGKELVFQSGESDGLKKEEEDGIPFNYWMVRNRMWRESTVYSMMRAEKGLIVYPAYRVCHCVMLHCHAASAEISGLGRTYSPLKP